MNLFKKNKKSKKPTTIAEQKVRLASKLGFCKDPFNNSLFHFEGNYLMCMYIEDDLDVTDIFFENRAKLDEWIYKNKIK